MLTKTKTSEEIKVFQNEHYCLFVFVLTLYTQQCSYFSYFTEKTVLKLKKQAGNQKRYNLQGLQKWKPKPSRTIGNKVDIYIIYVIFASTSKNKGQVYSLIYYSGWKNEKG